MDDYTAAIQHANNITDSGLFSLTNTPQEAFNNLTNSSEDIFAIQDDITIKLLEALPAKLIPGGLYHHYEGQVVSINAYITFLQGVEYFYRMTAGDNFNARKCFEKAISMDPNSSLAYAMLAYAHLNDIFQAWSKSPLESFEQTEKAALKAAQKAPGESSQSETTIIPPESSSGEEKEVNINE